MSLKVCSDKTDGIDSHSSFSLNQLNESARTNSRPTTSPECLVYSRSKSAFNLAPANSAGAIQSAGARNSPSRNRIPIRRQKTEAFQVLNTDSSKFDFSVIMDDMTTDYDGVSVSGSSSNRKVAMSAFKAISKLFR